MIRTTFALAVLTVWLAACGDNIKVAAAPDGPGPGPGDSSMTDATTPPPTPTAVIASGDFQMGHPGVMSTIDTKTLTVGTDVAPAGSVGDDPVLRKFGGELFVVNRSDGNNVTILDATTHALVAQLGTGAGTNPQDVAVVGQKLYVAIDTGVGLEVLTRGSNTVATIDLSALDPDGFPDCVSAYVVGTSVYVACDILDSTFTPQGPGKIAVIDTTTDTVTSVITMMTENPLGVFEQLPTGELAIPTVNFADGSGCIEKITTGASPASAGCIVDNATMTGYGNRIAFQSGSAATMWIAVADLVDFTKSTLWGYDMVAAKLGTAPISATGEDIIDVAVCPDNTLVASDHAMATGGVRVYRASSEVTTSPLVIGLTPNAAHGLACY